MINLRNDGLVFKCIRINLNNLNKRISYLEPTQKSAQALPLKNIISKRSHNKRSLNIVKEKVSGK